VLTVHYEQNYDNAFWNGEQLVFGDGDGTIFGSFTKPIDVLGHEFTDAVTQFMAGLEYQGQPGALNESVSDCFGACLKQRVLGQTADRADWLVGQGIFLPGVHARALRDMAHPGTAYDDPTLGKDPQVGDMSDYVDTTDDNGGVHINSGIPNRAFYLAATTIGGDTWEAPARSGTAR
jgi:Zn-dependent metalloprotease